MDPEIVLAVVAFALFGVVVALVAFPAGWGRLRQADGERVAWWRLVLPLLVGALVFAFFFGWAVQEADPADEHTGPVLHLLALMSGAVVLRAIVRAAKAVRLGASSRVPIGTMGLWTPRVVVSREFRENVSDDVLAAALAHETAHVRRRDPLRIWLAQLAADLQWPVPGTARRFSAWLLALETERDDEAVASGVAGEDLAEAILAAARLHRVHTPSLCAHIEGAGEGIAWRVRRLLAGDGPKGVPQRSTPFLAAGSCFALLSTAAWLGLHYGDAVLRVLPGMGP